MKNTILTITLFISFLTYAQITMRSAYEKQLEHMSGLGITVGYKNLKSNNLSIGITSSFYDGLMAGGNIEAKYITDYKKNHLGVLGFNVMVLGLSPGLNFSNKYIEPNLGIDLAYLRLNLGYAINYKSKGHFSFGVRILIPTTIEFSEKSYFIKLFF